MPNKFASGKYAIAHCDRCGFRTKLKELRPLTIKTKRVNIRVCNDCWESDHPQLQLGLYPVNDPQAVRDPRPDTSYAESRSISYQVLVGAGVGTEIGNLGLVPELFVVTEDDDEIVTEDYFNIVTENIGLPPEIFVVAEAGAEIIAENSFTIITENAGGP